LSYGGLIFGSNVGSQMTRVDSRLTPESLQFLAFHCILLQLSSFRKSFQGSVLRAFLQGARFDTASELRVRCSAA